MKITDIKVYPTFVNVRNQLIVKVESDEGYYGLGESGVSGREWAVKGAVDHYREFLIGKDPFRIGALWQEMYRSQYFEGGRVLTGAISAIDIAIWDLMGKLAGKPVFKLLGGRTKEKIPCYYSKLYAGPIDSMQAEAEEAYPQSGYPRSPRLGTPPQALPGQELVTT